MGLINFKVGVFLSWWREETKYGGFSNDPLQKKTRESAL